MSDPAPEPGEASSRPAASNRWQSYLQRSSDAVFLLNQHRRVIFVNPACEKLTGASLDDLRGKVCKRWPSAEDAGLIEALTGALAPPAEVLEGKIVQIRRALPAVGGRGARHWCDIAFVPLAGDDRLLCILGTIKPVARKAVADASPLPERIVALRHQFFQAFDLDNLAAASPAMQRVAGQARLAARLRAPVLLAGEPGTGKRWLGRAIHRQSPRFELLFAVLDCTRLPQQALAEALFGEAGLMRRPQLGTLYLHEPARLPREIQERLHQTAASWQEDDAGRPVLFTGAANIAEDVRAGRLLPEFQFFLSTFTVLVPPLRDRLADLDRLVEQLLERARAACDKHVASLSEDAQSLLRGYAWPGNIAELYQVLLDACQRTKSDRITVADLPFHLHPSGPAKPRVLELDSLLEKVERRLMLLALRQAGNNKTEAAALLSIWRQRLIRRMSVLGLDDARSPETSEAPDSEKT